MRIPFNLHRRIPLIRRPFHQRDAAMAERDALRAQVAMLSQTACEYRRLSDEYRRLSNPPHNAFVYHVPGAEAGAAAFRFLQLLRPMDVVGKQFVRKGKDNDGGYVMVDTGLENSLCYSLGINDDVSWDLEMAELGAQIFQYDHTIDRLPVEHPNFHFFKNGISAFGSSNGVMKSIPHLLEENGHQDQENIILKMDIESHEWDVFCEMDDQTLGRFSQIVMEIHCLASGFPLTAKKIMPALEKLYRIHQPVHIHANNHGYWGLVGGVMIPDCAEVTYVRRRDHAFVETKRVFPTELDMPCRAGAADYVLGPLGALPEPVLRR